MTDRADEFGPDHNRSDDLGAAVRPDAFGSDLLERDALRCTVAPDPLGESRVSSATLARPALPDPLGPDQLLRVHQMTHVRPDPLGGDHPLADTLATRVHADPSPHAVAAAAMRVVHRRRRFVQRQAIGLENALKAFIRREVLGVTAYDRKPIRDAAAAEVKAILAALRGSGPILARGEELPPGLHAELLGLSAALIPSIDAFAQQEDSYRRWMVATAATLPGAVFVADAPGLGLLGFAMIVGEAGELGAYATPARLWKRLGLAVIESERQQRKTDPLLAAAHGFNPQRRSVAWVVFDPVFRRQSREPKGPYRLAYDHARAGYDARGWGKLHAHRAAMRYAQKRLVLHLWRAWRREAGDP